MLTLFKVVGAGGRNRTDTELPPRDFESRASTNFTTPANVFGIIAKASIPVKEENQEIFSPKRLLLPERKCIDTRFRICYKRSS